MLTLTSPITGELMQPDGEHALTDGVRRWPVVAGIPYLRVGRNELCERALAAVDRGDERAALIELLRDQDDWAPDLPAEPHALEAMLEDPDLSLRKAMEALRFGPVADYFAHRWSAPTFLSGIGLLGHFWRPLEPVIEIACGIGQILREVARRGAPAVGVDVVFAKLWLARRFVLAPDVPLVCADVEEGIPLASLDRAAVLCHDAFYFLRRKDIALAAMRKLAGAGGVVLIGHAHNAAADHGPVAGLPLAPTEYAALASGATFYDDAALARAALCAAGAAPVPVAELKRVEAVSFTLGRAPLANPLDLAAPPNGTPLRLNPILRAHGDRLQVHWPTPALACEYANASYFADLVAPPADLLERARHGRLDGEARRLARQRVLLDLPDAW